MAEADDTDAWLRLVEAPGVSRAAARRLLAAFGSAEAVWQAPAAAIEEVAGRAAAKALHAAAGDDGLAARVAAARAWLAGGDGRSLVRLDDADYPRPLLASPDPPLLLYALGRREWLARPAVAVVGSRNPTPQGLENARAFGAALSAAGFTVVSGLALGIDGAAHEGGLAGPGGTIAVVGTGLDRVYPSRHRALAHRIAEAGLLLSEYAPGMPPLRENFPQRNRIIAGLAAGTLVVEAALASGSLITARLASEAGREVFAVPGSIHAPQSRGCHALIRDGATLVEHIDDLLAELRPWLPRPPAPPPAPEERDDPVLQALGHDPATLDALIARCGWSAAALGARLLELELDGDVARLPGGLFQRIARA